MAHGGGKRCQHEGCSKAAAVGGTQRCSAHGGGKRCQKPGCTKAVAQTPGSVFCKLCALGVKSESDTQSDDEEEETRQRERAAEILWKLSSKK